MCKMASVLIVPVVVLVIAIHAINCDLIPEKKCATLFSSANFDGDEYEVQHFDQFANLQKDYRASLNGFKKTKSAIVENGCILNLCNETYFLGTCQTLTSSSSSLGEFKPRSGNCTCPQECKCENVLIGKGEFGRAYLNSADCNSCTAEYLQLLQSDSNFSNDQGQVTGFALRSGCNLTVFAEAHHTGARTVLTAPFFQGFQGNVGSYQFSCDSSAYLAPPIKHSSSCPSLIQLPPTQEKLLALLQSGNASLSDHPGFQAALESTKSGRSSSFAYVVLIGINVPKLAGFPECESIWYTHIGECRIPLVLDELGVANSHLRLILVPASCFVGSSYVGSDNLMATLDEYLSNHEELNNTIPNAVVLYHWIFGKFDDTINGTFHSKMQVLHALRGRLFEENYSNLVILMEDLKEPNNLQPQQQERFLNEIENIINRNWTFPNPLVMLPMDVQGSHVRNENGYRRMPNGEYWPMSLQASLMNLCKKGHDPLGAAIFKKYFQIREFFSESLHQVLFPTVLANHPKVAHYRNLAAQPFAPENSTFRKITSSRKMLQVSSNGTLIKETLGGKFNQTSCHIKEQSQCAKVQDMEQFRSELQKIIDNRVAALLEELSNERLARQEDSKRFNAEIAKLNSFVEKCQTDLTTEKRTREQELQKVSAELESEKQSRMEESLKIKMEIMEQIKVDLQKLFLKATRK